MSRKEYSAGAVKHSFWFMEFRKVVALRNDGMSWDEIKERNEKENIFGAPTPMRQNQIWNTVSGRIKCLDDGPARPLAQEGSPCSFYPVFQLCDVSAQKLFALVAAMAYDTLFAEFVYEVIREKMLIGSNDFTDADIRIFFHNKQVQDETTARWTDATIRKLCVVYKQYLLGAGITDDGRAERKILKPILDPSFEHWLQDHEMAVIVKALTGEA